MTRRSVAARLTALETRKRAGVRNFVVGMSDPPTAEELEALALAEAEGLPFRPLPEWSLHCVGAFPSRRAPPAR